MLKLRKLLLCLAVILPIVACVRLSIDMLLQMNAILDGPLANPFQKAQAVRDTAIAFFISGLTFLIVFKEPLASKSTKALWISNYLLMSGVLLAISLIIFFWPYTSIGMGRDFYFATWSTGLQSIHYLIRDFTVIILAIFIALRIRKIN